MTRRSGNDQECSFTRTSDIHDISIRPLVDLYGSFKWLSGKTNRCGAYCPYCSKKVFFLFSLHSVHPPVNAIHRNTLWCEGCRCCCTKPNFETLFIQGWLAPGVGNIQSHEASIALNRGLLCLWKATCKCYFFLYLTKAMHTSISHFKRGFHSMEWPPPLIVI